MSLLQIAEPGFSSLPHQHRLAVGIDLGTTHSLVATVRSGSTEVLKDEHGHALLPSVVRYQSDGNVTVGDNARIGQSEDPANTFISVKRFMGRAMRDISFREQLPYRFGDDEKIVRFDTYAGSKTPIEISAEILRTLRQRAEQSLGGELVGAVITVPAYFDEAQRQATKDAARLAGINVLRLLNEPTAAAVAYGLDNGDEGVYAIYDLGGGTFDISILRLTRGVFEVLAVNGDGALGGDDFDRAIADWAIAQSGNHTLDDKQRGALMRRARLAKERLSTEMQTAFVIPNANGKLIQLTLTRSQFESISTPLVTRTLTPVKRALRDAGFTLVDIDGVVLVGGATRMPMIRAACAELFGKPPLTNLDPDQVVALGAAVQANILAGNAPNDDLVLLDVTPLSLGLETMGGMIEKIIPRNSTLPLTRAQEFTTFKDGQTALALHIVQGERELVRDCRSLARIELRGIPPMAAGAARIRVTFQVDTDGLLTVTAREQHSGVETNITVKPSYGLTDDEVARMLSESRQFAAEDAMSRALAEEIVEAERLIVAIEAAIEQDGDILLNEEERREIEQGIIALRRCVASGDRAAIHQQSKQLNESTTAYAAKRMNQNIHKALSGKRVDEVSVS